MLSATCAALRITLQKSVASSVKRRSCPYNRSMATKPQDTSSAFTTGVATAITAVRNGATRLRNSIIKVLPGERPEWRVLELTGTFPARKAKRKMLSPENLMGAEKHVSQEELVTIVTALCEADWLKGVVVRIQDMQVD